MTKKELFKLLKDKNIMYVGSQDKKFKFAFSEKNQMYKYMFDIYCKRYEIKDVVKDHLKKAEAIKFIMSEFIIINLKLYTLAEDIGIRWYKNIDYDK